MLPFIKDSSQNLQQRACGQQNCTELEQARQEAEGEEKNQQLHEIVQPPVHSEGGRPQ